MKKLLFTLLLTFGFTMVWSQEYATDKGAKFFGLSGSFSSQSGDLYEDNDGNGLTSINLNPSFNYLVAKNFFIGGGLEFLNQKQGDYSQSTIGIGPQIGVFFANQESKVFPYLSLGFKYYSMSMGFGSGSDASLSGTNISLGAGMVIPVQEHIGITFDCSYNIQNLKTSGVSVSGNILTIGVGILGFIF
jgi:hypothetical protein